MAIFQSNQFFGERLQLDGNVFEGNQFTNCVLVYGGGQLTLANNTLIGIRWEFVDAAARTIALLASFYQSGGESKQFVELLLSTYGKPTALPVPNPPANLTNA